MINKNMLEKNVHRFILSSVPSSFIVVFEIKAFGFSDKSVAYFFGGGG